METIKELEEYLSNITIIDPYSKYFTGSGLHDTNHYQKIELLTDEEFNKINDELNSHFNKEGDYK